MMQRCVAQATFAALRRCWQTEEEEEEEAEAEEEEEEEAEGRVLAKAG